MEEKNLQARAQRLRTAQKQRRRWQGMVSALAAIVVLLTACCLTLPAVTMTRGGNCSGSRKGVCRARGADFRARPS